MGISDTPKVNQPRPFYVFGDSLVDNGNNNFLYTTARADMPPYGIDTPSHLPNGRFSNGLNIPDIISEYIGSEPVLPYLSPELTDEKLPMGANFASAGIGILNDTGIMFANTIRMPKQILYFKDYQQRLSALLGEKQAKQLVNKGLVLVSLGGNDFVNNYFLTPFSARSFQYSLPDYVTYVISEYRNILMTLYDLGVRRAILMGPGPLGCAPAMRARRSLDGQCATSPQAAAELFEPQLYQMVQDLNNQLGSHVFITAHTKLMHEDIFSNPQAFGFENSDTACCGQGRFNGMGVCTPLSSLCDNRDKFVFWDAFHPTERANRFIVQQMMNGTFDYMRPMNINTIMYLDSNL
ncbi:GDSL esterase/lipase At5g33370-like [Rutidosis leptorrhynchoides]|uniref:GDSL esterase/lipase At5g33370-like n=1 Tax=Rutidosis leptorrhynchoides TaxID=125765 RepID=UPI003A99A4AC